MKKPSSINTMLPLLISVLIGSVPLVLDWASPEQHYCYWPRVSPSHLPRLPLAEAALFHTSSRALIGGEVSTFTPRTWPPLATGTTRHWSYTAHCIINSSSSRSKLLLTMFIFNIMQETNGLNLIKYIMITKHSLKLHRRLSCY